MFENDHAEFWKNLFHGGLGFPLAATDFPGNAAFRIPLAEAVRLCQLFQPARKPVYDTRNYFELEAFNDPIGETAPDIPHSVGYMSSSPSGQSPNTISALVSPSMTNTIATHSGFFGQSKTEKTLVVIDNTRAPVVHVRIALKRAAEHGIPSTDIIILLIDQSWSTHATRGGGVNRAYIPEEMFLFIVGSYLRRRGYILDLFGNNLLPANMFPDHFAVRLPDVQQALANHGFIKSASVGFYPFELESNLFQNGPSVPAYALPKGRNESIALEMKSTKSEGRSAGRLQMEEYLAYGFFSQGIVAAPFMAENFTGDSDGRLTTANSPDLLLKFLSLTRDGDITFIDSDKDWSIPSEVDQTYRTVERIVKESILKNLLLPEQLSIVSSLVVGRDAHSVTEFLDQIADVPCDDLFGSVRKCIDRQRKRTGKPPR